MQDTKKVPKSAISRISLYLREITRLEKEAKESVSSTELGDMTGLTDAQVRKDLSYFGQFGRSGAGYDVHPLKRAIEGLLGKNKTWEIVLIGAGNIGSALLRYPGFKDQGFFIKEAFDSDSKRIDKRYGEVSVKDVKKLEETVRANKDIKIAILAVPAESAQSVADLLVKAGIKCILNFAPALLKLNSDVLVKNIDLSNELESFSFFLASRED
ncbi:MAG: redox-sensing transcriptional repressor Rex [Candidatus Omnitrophica bacterium]|nr:redox-sensing transcriptional repressor Rex [Candidatus Omnitrophota bacterium]